MTAVRRRNLVKVKISPGTMRFVRPSSAVFNSSRRALATLSVVATQKCP